MPASAEATTIAIATVIVLTRRRTGLITTSTSEVDTLGDPISGMTSPILSCMSIGSIGSFRIIVCYKWVIVIHCGMDTIQIHRRVLIQFIYSSISVNSPLDTGTTCVIGRRAWLNANT